MKKISWKTYGLAILLTEAVGALSGWLTREGAKAYSETVEKPPLSPPDIVFPIVWGILFALMGVGLARIYSAEAVGLKMERTKSLVLFFVQLFFNFFWSILFFNLQNFGLAFWWLVVLWGLILWMILSFRKVDKWSAWLQIPYFLWVTFAAYLNSGVWILNG